MRVAVVDIGTNSTRLLIAEVEDGRIAAELERESNVTRLGVGVDAGGRLSDEGIERVRTALDRYAQQIEHRRAETKIAVLTSAVRDAENGDEFATMIQTDYGLEPHILTGEQEARLTFVGATSERDPDDTTTILVVDIGGGSTELVIGSGHEPRFHVSTQAGVVRQTERHLHDDPPQQAQLTQLRGELGAVFDTAVPNAYRKGVEHAIAVAGTATSLAAIAQRLEPYDPEKVQGYVLRRPQIADILDRLKSVPLQERRQTPGLHPDRAPTIVAGVVILQQVLELFELERIEVSEHDILRGAALALATS